MSHTLFRTKDGRARPWVAWLLIAAMAPFMSGCYGSFQAVKAVYKFNGEVSDDKLVRSVVMWGLVILPVYYVAALADGIVLNPIEYWNGTKINVAQRPDANGPSAVAAPSEPPQRVVFVVFVGPDGSAMAAPVSAVALAGQTPLPATQ